MDRHCLSAHFPSASPTLGVSGHPVCLGWGGGRLPPTTPCATLGMGPPGRAGPTPPGQPRAAALRPGGAGRQPRRGSRTAAERRGGWAPASLPAWRPPRHRERQGWRLCLCLFPPLGMQKRAKKKLEEHEAHEASSLARAVPLRAQCRHAGRRADGRGSCRAPGGALGELPAAQSGGQNRHLCQNDFNPVFVS